MVRGRPGLARSTPLGKGRLRRLRRPIPTARPIRQAVRYVTAFFFWRLLLLAGGAAGSLLLPQRGRKVELIGHSNRSKSLFVGFQKLDSDRSASRDPPPQKIDLSPHHPKPNAHTRKHLPGHRRGGGRPDPFSGPEQQQQPRRHACRLLRPTRIDPPRPVVWTGLPWPSPPRDSRAESRIDPPPPWRQPKGVPPRLDRK